MSALSIQPTYPIFTDIDGQPLEDGYVWIGTANLDPQVNPINVFWDAALTIPAGQPIRTLGGYPSNSGTPARLYVNSDYSIRVMNKNGSVVYSAPAATERFGDVIDANTISYTALGTGAVSRSVKNRLDDFITVFDYMTQAQIADVQSGAATIDVTTALQNALDASLNVYFPPGRYLITGPLTLRTNQRIQGCGQNFSYPYYNNTFNVYATEILVSNFVAFDLSNTQNVTAEGFGIRSSLGGDSAYGQPANYGANSCGFLVTTTQWAQIRDVGFLGLDYGIYGVTGVNFMRVNNFVASDCDNVIRIGDTGSTPYTGADVQITNCVYSIHCNKHIEVHACDGIRLENLRLFQSYNFGIHIRACPFVILSGVTQFETYYDGVRIEDCTYVSAAATIIARSGGYITTVPWRSSAALYITGSSNVSWQGTIERPGGRGINMIDCSNVKLDMSILQPFYTTQSASPGTINAALSVQTSSKISANLSVDGNVNVLYGIATDFASYDEIVGSVSGNDYLGTNLGFYAADPKLTVIHDLATDTLINIASSTSMTTKRFLVPAGKKLVSRCMHMTSPDVTLRVGALFWVTNLVTEADGGFTCYNKETLYDNSAGVSDVWTQVAFQIYNNSGAPITVPAGHRSLISLAYE